MGRTTVYAESRARYKRLERKGWKLRTRKAASVVWCMTDAVDGWLGWLAGWLARSLVGSALGDRRRVGNRQAVWARGEADPTSPTGGRGQRSRQQRAGGRASG